MLTASQAFQNAAAASDRQVVVRATTWFLDNLLLLGFVEADGDENEALFSVDTLVNGKTSPPKTWALARGDCYPADDLYPLDEGCEAGWLGDNVSDGAGDLSTSEVVIVDYATTQRLNEVRLWGDTWLGYPVDFLIEYWDADDLEWAEIQDVSGNAETEWSHTLTTSIQTTRLRLTITKISRANDLPAAMEFQGGLAADLAPYIQGLDIVKERFYEQQGSVPIGNYGAGEINLTLENTDGRFYSRNTEGPYYGYLKPNRRIEMEIGFVTGSGDEYVPAGVFYVVAWRASSGSPTCRVVARDRAKRFQGLMYETAVQQSSTISDLVTLLAAAGALDETEYDIVATTYQVPYAIFERTSVWEHLRELAIGEAGFVYFDEDGHLVFENRDHLASETVVQETLDDDDFIVSVDDEVDEGRIRNYIRVTSQRRKEAASDTIWSLQETLTIPGSGEWWNASWYRRRQLTITADGGAGNNLAANDCVKLTITGDAAAAIYDVCQSDGGDLRVVYESGGYTELDRYIEHFTEEKITVYFQVQAAIAAGASDTDRYLYYYNPSAGAPQDDGADVFDVHDDFDRASLGSDWAQVGYHPEFNIADNHLRSPDRFADAKNAWWDHAQAGGSFEAHVKARRPERPIEWDANGVGLLIETAIPGSAEKYGGYTQGIYLAGRGYCIRVCIQTPNGFDTADQPSGTWDNSIWHTFRLEKHDTTWRLYVDDALWLTRSGDSYNPLYHGILRENAGSPDGFATLFDEWWIRFATDVEPTISAADEDAKPAVVTGAETCAIRVQFQGPAVDIQAPVITDAGPDISVQSYSYNSTGGEVVLQKPVLRRLFQG